MGLELVVSMGLCYAIGRWADGRFGTKYWALVGLVIGVIAGFRNLLRAANLMQREAEREEAEERAAVTARNAALPRPLVVDDDEVAVAPKVEVEVAPKPELDIRPPRDGGKEDPKPNARGSKDGDAPS